MAFTPKNLLILDLTAQDAYELSPTDLSTVAIYPALTFAHERSYDFLPDGRWAIAQAPGSTATSVKIFDRTPTALLSGLLAGSWPSTRPLAGDFDDAFYVVWQSNVVKKISATDGSTLLTTSALSLGTSSVPVGLGISADGNTLYYGDRTGALLGPTGPRIRKWDLQTDSFAGDLVLLNSGSGVCDFMRQLPDRTLLIHVTVGVNQEVRHYDLSGNLLGTWSGASLTNVSSIHRDAGDSSYFWAFAVSNVPTVNTAHFYKVRVSDMTEVLALERNFSPSVPIWMAVIPTMGTTSPTTPEPILVNSDPSCVKSSDPAVQIAGPVLPFVGPGWTPACVGGATVPTAAALSPEVWD